MPATLTRPKSVQLQERIAMTAPNVDRENFILHDVKVLGDRSRNNRVYNQQAMRRALPLYEGVRVCVEHLTQGRAKSRVGDVIGILRNPRFKVDSVIADLHLLKSHPRAEYILETAELAPGSIGLSHHADGATEKRGRQTIVTDITRVESVDLVADPASTNGLFESGRSLQENYPTDYAGFVRALRRPARPPVTRRAVPQSKSTRSLLQEMLPGDASHTGAPSGPAGGQFVEILNILDDENLSDSQKVEQIRAYVDKNRDVRESYFPRPKKYSRR